MRDPRVHGKYAVPTHANTSFMKWWPLLNSELSKLDQAEALYADARAVYEMGESPETGATQIASEREALA
jgi:hypothetical protein